VVVAEVVVAAAVAAVAAVVKTAVVAASAVLGVVVEVEVVTVQPGPVILIFLCYRYVAEAAAEVVAVAAAVELLHCTIIFQLYYKQLTYENWSLIRKKVLLGCKTLHQHWNIARAYMDDSRELWCGNTTYHHFTGKDPPSIVRPSIIVFFGTIY